MPTVSKPESYKDLSSESSTREFNTALSQPLHAAHDTEVVLEPREAYQNNKDENIEVMKPTHSGSNQKGINPPGTVIKYLQSSSLKSTLPYQFISMASDGLDAIAKTASKIREKKNIK